jgi:hypothetical protein
MSTISYDDLLNVWKDLNAPTIELFDKLEYANYDRGDLIYMNVDESLLAPFNRSKVFNGEYVAKNQILIMNGKTFATFISSYPAVTYINKYKNHALLSFLVI